nr:hypothetical protein [Bacillus licheniformis]
MKRTIIGKKPFQHSIRGDSSFCNDILKITSPDHETVRLSWEISEAALSAAEAVLFENIRDVEKQILLFCVKNGERGARTIHTGAFKGEASVFPSRRKRFLQSGIPDIQFAQHVTGRSLIRLLLPWGKRNPFKQQTVFSIKTISRIGRLNFPHIRDIL